MELTFETINKKVVFNKPHMDNISYVGVIIDYEGDIAIVKHREENYPIHRDKLKLV